MSSGRGDETRKDQPQGEWEGGEWNGSGRNTSPFSPEGVIQVGRKSMRVLYLLEQKSSVMNLLRPLSARGVVGFMELKCPNGNKSIVCPNEMSEMIGVLHNVPVRWEHSVLRV